MGTEHDTGIDNRDELELSAENLRAVFDGLVQQNSPAQLLRSCKILTPEEAVVRLSLPLHYGDTKQRFVMAVMPGTVDKGWRGDDLFKFCIGFIWIDEDGYVQFQAVGPGTFELRGIGHNIEFPVGRGSVRVLREGVELDGRYNHVSRQHFNIFNKGPYYDDNTGRLKAEVEFSNPKGVDPPAYGTTFMSMLVPRV